MHDLVDQADGEIIPSISLLEYPGWMSLVAEPIQHQFRPAKVILLGVAVLGNYRPDSSVPSTSKMKALTMVLGIRNHNTGLKSGKISAHIEISILII